MFGGENIAAYRYGHNVNRFCKICGVPLGIGVVGPPEGVTRNWTGVQKEYLDNAKKMHPIALRILDGIEWKGQPGETDGENVAGKVQVERVDGKSFPTPEEDAEFYLGPVD